MSQKRRKKDDVGFSEMMVGQKGLPLNLGRINENLVEETLCESLKEY